MDYSLSEGCIAVYNCVSVHWRGIVLEFSFGLFPCPLYHQYIPAALMRSSLYHQSGLSAASGIRNIQWFFEVCNWQLSYSAPQYNFFEKYRNIL